LFLFLVSHRIWPVYITPGKQFQARALLWQKHTLTRSAP
jgi:hypothetical protein